MTNKYLNSAQIAAMFGVSMVTIYHWRKGSAKLPALPTATIKYTGKAKPPVRFLPSQVAAWAKKNRVTVVDPTQVPTESAVAKPGPKPRPVVTEAPKKASDKKASDKATKPVKVPTKEQEQKASKAKKPVTKPLVKKATKAKKAALVTATGASASSHATTEHLA